MGGPVNSLGPLNFGLCTECTGNYCKYCALCSFCAGIPSRHLVLTIFKLLQIGINIMQQVMCAELFKLLTKYCSLITFSDIRLGWTSITNCGPCYNLKNVQIWSLSLM